MEEENDEGSIESENDSLLSSAGNKTKNDPKAENSSTKITKKTGKEEGRSKTGKSVSRKRLDNNNSSLPVKVAFKSNIKSVNANGNSENTHPCQEEENEASKSLSNEETMDRYLYYLSGEEEKL